MTKIYNKNTRYHQQNQWVRVISI